MNRLFSTATELFQISYALDIPVLEIRRRLHSADTSEAYEMISICRDFFELYNFSIQNSENKREFPFQFAD